MSNFLETLLYELIEKVKQIFNMISIIDMVFNWGQIDINASLSYNFIFNFNFKFIICLGLAIVSNFF